jgi:hypothetical protein
LRARKVLTIRYVGYLFMRTLIPIAIALVSMILALFNPLVAKIFLILDPVSIWLGHLFRMEE